MSHTVRTEWSEFRNVGGGIRELFFVVAQETHGICRFFERSSWDLCWCEVPSSPQLRAKLSTAGAEHNPGEAKSRSPRASQARPLPTRHPHGLSQAQGFGSPVAKRDRREVQIGGLDRIPGTCFPARSPILYPPRSHPQGRLATPSNGTKTAGVSEEDTEEDEASEDPADRGGTPQGPIADLLH